jgi:hypothetical protein
MSRPATAATGQEAGLPTAEGRRPSSRGSDAPVATLDAACCSRG